MSNLLKNYLRVNKVVSHSDNVLNQECLFTNDYEQIFLTDNNVMSVNGEGYIILDFGKEICGGIRILTSYIKGKGTVFSLRIRFGESLMECNANIGDKNATNNHAIRDLDIALPELGDQEIGQTGFRFVRIDFKNPDIIYCIKNIVAVSYLRDLPVDGKFTCDDARINDIFDTCSRTIHLCMQNMLWDGIKRDRLVWVGDMQPEVLASLYVFGGSDVVEKTIIESEKHYKLPIWFGAIPTYNAWYIQIVGDYYKLTEKEDFAKDRIPYINGILKQFDDSIDEYGNIDYSICAPTMQKGYFIDWPSSESNNLEEGNRCLLLYVFKNAKESLSSVGIDVKTIDKLITKLLIKKPDHVLEEKQLCAFQVLTNQVKYDDAYKALIKDRANGLSTFMSYFILSAIAKKDINVAIDIMKEYYGGMLDLGATSFWEDFDIKWLENASRIDEMTKQGQVDVHGDYGKYCYIGYRHSLCHGWSSGPIQFIFENIVGIKILENGYRKVSIKPNPGDLINFEASLPTPYGVLKISYNNGKTTIVGPKEIEIV